MTTPEQEARAATIASIRHSSTLEGGQSTPAAQAIQDLWVAGEIDADELVRRTQALYGLPPQPGDSHYPAGDVDPDDEIVTRLVDAYLPEALIDLAIATTRQHDEDTPAS